MEREKRNFQEKRASNRNLERQKIKRNKKKGRVGKRFKQLEKRPRDKEI